MTTELPPPPPVAGRSLSGETPFVISRAENRALYESVGAVPPAGDRAHPVYFYIATQVGMGLTVAELCRACDFDVKDGPMIVGSRVTFQRPLLVEIPYIVTGEIVSLVRRSSRKLGIIDMLEYQLRLSTSDGVPVLATTNTWVLPRRGSP